MKKTLGAENTMNIAREKQFKEKQELQTGDNN